MDNPTVIGNTPFGVEHESLTKNEKKISDGCSVETLPLYECAFIYSQLRFNNPRRHTSTFFLKNSHFQIVEMREHLIPSNIAFLKRRQAAAKAQET